MLSLALTVLILVAVYFLQQVYPFLAGILAVAPVKVIATSFMVFEEGGVARLQESLSGMLIGQMAFTSVLFLVWVVLKQ